MQTEPYFTRFHFLVSADVLLRAQVFFQKIIIYVHKCSYLHKQLWYKFDNPDPKVIGFGLILSAYGTIQKEIDHVKVVILVTERKYIMKRFYSISFLIKLTDALISQIYFSQETLHASGSSFAHHQEFSTVHSALVYVMQV